MDLLAGGFERVGTAFFPYVDAAGTEGEALLVCETVVAHGEATEGDGVEDDLGIADVADAHAGDGGCLADHDGGGRGVRR